MLKVTFGAAVAVARLQSMTTTQLRARYVELLKVQPRTNNRSYLFKRLALKVQEPGGKSAFESKGESKQAITTIRDPRLPGVGSVLTKTYKGRALKVVVNEKDFTFEGERFRSLSAIARKVTGIGWNGFLFFGLIPAGKAV